MATRVNQKLIEVLEPYGAEDVMKCYSCGNCSAACPFSKEPNVFPRRPMHYLQMGLEDKLKGQLDPWLCYYCGECSDQCPREAEPGETMMSLRRWLTAQYDFTGISKMLYRSGTSELVAVLIVALLTGIGFLAFGFTQGGGNLAVYDGPGAFLPAHDIHIFDWTMGGILGLLLGINCLRMWYFTMRGENSIPVPLSLYIKHIFTLPLHFFTQKSFQECEKKRPWRNHMILMFSYLTMLILIMGFVKQMQAGPQVNWYVHFFGYLASIGLVTMGIVAVQGRLNKDETFHKHSHESDWMFLILLLYVSITGIAQHILHRVGMPEAANITYVLHLMGVVPMLGLEVPFAKWSHLAYRPLAIYFAQLQDAAQAEGAVPLGAPAKPQPAA
jgi:ferredoxin